MPWQTSTVTASNSDNRYPNRSCPHHHPTPASIDPLLSKPHKDLLTTTNNNNPPLHRFLVTKLRSWRTAYPRILPLHSNHFTRNMLSERVESLPSLLRLEGRLGLLGKLG